MADNIKWETDMDAAMALARVQNKPVFLESELWRRPLQGVLFFLRAGHVPKRARVYFQIER